MNKNLLSFTISILFLAFTCAYAGKPGGCSDVPISITFLATNAAPAAIWNDDPTKPYTGGTNTQIHACNGGVDGTGSYDATMVTPRSRTVTLKFPAAIGGSLIEGGPASFAGGNAISTQPFINIRNIAGYTVIPPGVAATYYTRIAISFTGPDSKSYRLLFFPDDGACPGDYPCVPDLHGVGDPANKNMSEQMAWAKVTYLPRPNPTQPWSASNADSWIVEGELSTSTDTEIQRATVFYVPRKGPAVHFGQYSMPFKILVTALAALPQ